MLKWFARFVLDRLIFAGLIYLAYPYLLDEMPSVKTDVAICLQRFEAPFDTLSRALD